MERRLAAILAADVVGYSRLIREDEDGTIAALRIEVLNPQVKKNRGRLVKTMGDGVLIEFTSVVDAVSCARDFQIGMVERNSGTPQNRQLKIRVGVNLGDVVIDGTDIQRDGVNVAARLEGLAEPGGKAPLKCDLATIERKCKPVKDQCASFARLDRPQRNALVQMQHKSSRETRRARRRLCGFHGSTGSCLCNRVILRTPCRS